MISPSRQELTIIPGQEQSFDITVKNLSDRSVLAKYFINDFTSDNYTGEPRIIVDSDIASSSSIKPFVQGVSDFVLAAGETKVVTAKISVPDSANRRAYYGLIRFQPVPVDSSGEVETDVQFSVSGSLGVLVLLEVPGADSPSGRIVESFVSRNIFTEENTAADEITGGWIFSRGSPNEVGVTVENTGTTFIRPYGELVVKNMFGSEVSRTKINNVNPRGVVLPQTTRTYLNPLEVSGFGRFKMTVSLAFVEGGEVVSQTVTFWVMPLWLIAVISVLVAVNIFYAWSLVKKRLA